MHETSSALSGSIRVVDRGDERRLIAGGDTLSAIPLASDWTGLRGAYWSRALDAASLTSRPAALFVGAGGCTQIHLLHARARPRAVTVVERDPVILQVAQRYFRLDHVPRAEFLCAAIEDVLPWLESSARRFDFIMEDAAYRAPLDQALALITRLAGLLGPRGTLVLNRHARFRARETAGGLRALFARVILRRMGDNALICATGLRRHPPPAPPRAAGPRRSPVTTSRAPTRARSTG